MNYADDTPVRVGDLVGLGEDRNGVVVCSIDDDVYADGYPETEWGYLARGVMINFPKWGLVHYETLEAGLEFISRAADQ